VCKKSFKILQICRKHQGLDFDILVDIRNVIFVESSRTSRKGGNVGNVNRKKFGNWCNCRARLYNGNAREKRLVNGARLKWRERGENSDRIGLEEGSLFRIYVHPRSCDILIKRVFIKSGLEMSPSYWQ